MRLRTIIGAAAAFVVSLFTVGLLFGFGMINRQVVVRNPATGGGQVVKCIGAFDEGDPAFIYKLDTTNMVLSIVFVETVIIPVVIGNNHLRCPIAIK